MNTTNEPQAHNQRHVRTDRLRADALARAWHTLSDHARDGVDFGSPMCNCLLLAPRLAQLLDWFDPTIVDEPEGLGAVVTNPVTGAIWIHATHPDLPWHGSPNPSPQSWCDPMSEDWFTWEDLPRPLQVEVPGWMPATSPTSDGGEVR